MAFIYNGINFTNIAVQSVHGRRGLGVSQLLFSIAFDIPAAYAPEGVSVKDIEASVSVTRDTGGNPVYLGTAYPERPWGYDTRPGINPRVFVFRLTLSGEQLLALEELRQGHGLRFQLTVGALAYGPKGEWPQYDDSVQHTVNLTAWTKVLSDLGGDEYITVGIALPSAEGVAHLQEAVGRLRRAHKALLDGHYDTAVSECRLAIDSAQTVTGDAKVADEMYQAFQRDPGSWRSMTKIQREIFVGQAIRHYTHLAHHSDEVGRVQIFSRDDALFVLAACAGVLSSANRRTATAAPI